MMTTMTTTTTSEQGNPSLDSTHKFDRCAHVTRSGKPCMNRRWYHDMGRARHKFIKLEHEQVNIAHYTQIVTALRNLVAADNCNYDRATMRSEGYFDAAREALRAAGEEI